MSFPHDSPADPENGELERLLQQATAEPAYRPAFFRTLLEATVFVPGDAGQWTPAGKMPPAADNPVQLQHWVKPDGTSVIPFFTSLAKLQQSVETTGQPFLALPARELFEMTLGERLFLNPQLEYGKEFYPQEVAQLLQNGGVFQVEERVVNAGSRILLQPPPDYPCALVDALTTLFSQRKLVRRAFLTLMHDQEGDEQPNLLVGVELEGSAEEIDALIQEAGSVAGDMTPEGEVVDFCLVSPEERGISHYLITHTQPFYQRKWGSWLRNIIPSSGLA